jgi:hypothetical protein
MSHGVATVSLYGASMCVCTLCATNRVCAPFVPLTCGWLCCVMVAADSNVITGQQQCVVVRVWRPVLVAYAAKQTPPGLLESWPSEARKASQLSPQTVCAQQSRLLPKRRGLNNATTGVTSPHT